VDLRVHGRTARVQRGTAFYLNIWDAAGFVECAAAGLRLPLMAAANVEGSGSIPAYDGEGLASKGLVVRHLQLSRLGSSGFCSYPETEQRKASYHAVGQLRPGSTRSPAPPSRWVARQHRRIRRRSQSRDDLPGQFGGARSRGPQPDGPSPLAKGPLPACDRRQRRRDRRHADDGRSGGRDGVRFAEAKNAALDRRAARDPVGKEVVTPVQGVRFAPLPDGYGLAVRRPRTCSPRANRTTCRR